MAFGQPAPVTPGAEWIPYAEHAKVLAEAVDLAEQRACEKARQGLAEARAENDALRAAMVLKTSDFPALKAQIDRLKGELAEARRFAEAIECWATERPLAAPSPADSPTFEQLVERVGPLPTTQLAGAAESTGVAGMLCTFCDGHGRVPPLHNSTCNLCRGTGLQQPAAPPDDIREAMVDRFDDHEAKISALGRRLKALDDKMADEARDTSRSWLDHEERLKALEESPCMREDCAVRAAEADPNYPGTPAAPQEQAGHAPHFFSGCNWDRCEAMLGPSGQQIKCDQRIDHPSHTVTGSHTGAKP